MDGEKPGNRASSDGADALREALGRSVFPLPHHAGRLPLEGVRRQGDSAWPYAAPPRKSYMIFLRRSAVTENNLFSIASSRGVHS